MPAVRDVLRVKGSSVLTVSPGATVKEAVDKMNRHKVGALVVTDDGRVTGIFTERDVLKRVVGAERLPQEIVVADVMTPNVVCCGPDEDLDDVSATMKDRRFRHLPVCEGGDLVGLISIGDLNAQHASHQEAQISFLNEYIYGRV